MKTDSLMDYSDKTNEIEKYQRPTTIDCGLIVDELNKVAMMIAQFNKREHVKIVASAF